MAKSISNTVLDAALAVIATAITMHVTSAEPANFAGVAAVSLADVTLTAGDGNGDYTIADGDTSGRKITVAQQADIPIDASGTATHVALVTADTLILVTTCTSQALTSGGTVTVPAFDDELADPA